MTALALLQTAHRDWPGAKKPEFSAEVGLKLTLCIFLAEWEVAYRPPSLPASGKAPADQPLCKLGPLQWSLDTHPPSTFPAPSFIFQGPHSKVELGTPLTQLCKCPPRLSTLRGQGHCPRFTD